MPDDRYGQNH